MEWDGELLTQDTYDRVPVRYMREGVRRYVEFGIPPGNFLQAVVCNDLKEAVGRADDRNLAHLVDWVKWFYNLAPAVCWGSVEKYEAWLEKHRERRRAACAAQQQGEQHEQE